MQENVNFMNVLMTRKTVPLASLDKCLMAHNRGEALVNLLPHIRKKSRSALTVAKLVECLKLGVEDGLFETDRRHCVVSFSKALK